MPEKTTIKPKNWKDFQHYKDRSPSWIKLHKRLIDDYEFQMLPVASRALAPMLWLLASEYHDAEINESVAAMAFRMRMKEAEFIDAVNPLIHSSFFECLHDASGLLAQGLHREEREKRREEKEKTCLEQAGASSKPALVSILLKSGETADFNIDQITETAKSFPRLSFDDVKNELLKCALWNKDNPKRRKTELGISRHISTWLSKADENRSGKTQSNEAALAWDNVTEQIGAVGKAGDPNIDDKTRNAIDRLFGGWMPMCNSTTKDLQFARAKFINLYNGG